MSFRAQTPSKVFRITTETAFVRLLVYTAQTRRRLRLVALFA